ncbi:MAG: hypothetical protein ABJA35_10940 [Parafilimonas sp.]
MKLYKALAIASSLILITSCGRKNSIELNTIVLKDPVVNVQDSILKLNSLLQRLPPTSNGDFKNYTYANSSNLIQPNIGKDSFLFINNSRVDKNTIDTVSVLSNYTSSEKRNIVALTAYLKDNYLWGAGSNGYDIWSYDYRGSCEKGFDECRQIIALQNLSDTLKIAYGKVFDKIIDRKEKLVLCSLKDIYKK